MTHIHSHWLATVMQNHAEQSTDHAVYLYKSNSTQSQCKHQTTLLMAEYLPYQGMPSHSSTLLMAEYPPYQGMPSHSNTLLMAEYPPHQGMPSHSSNQRHQQFLQLWPSCPQVYRMYTTPLKWPGKLCVPNFAKTLVSSCNQCDNRECLYTKKRGFRWPLPICMEIWWVW